MRKRLVIAVLYFFLSAAPSHAAGEFACVSELQPEVSKTLVAAVEAQYKEFSELTAKFTQYSFFIGLGRKKEIKSEGTVAFKKPGKMSWEYKTPEAQSFVTDGDTLWFYQPDLKQVTLGDFKKSF